MQKNIVLVGFMGAGKSLVSKMLSRNLKRKRVSTDEEIAERTGKTIAHLFEEYGEAYFRRLEEVVVTEISKRAGLIVDCGGGVVLNPENLANLKKNGILFYLSTSPEIIYKRVKAQTHRPLLAVSDPETKIRELLAVRTAFYEQADFTINTDQHTVKDTTEEVLKILSYERT